MQLALLVAAGVCITGAVFAWLALPSRVPHHELNVSELAIDEFVVDSTDFDETPSADGNNTDHDRTAPHTPRRPRLRRGRQARPR
jgi:hypothetical protein